MNYDDLVSKLQARQLHERCVVSTLHVNNELGTIEDLATIAEHVQRFGVELHVDISQSLGKIPIPMGNIEYATFSGRKFHGPHIGGIIFNDTNIRPEDVHTGTPSVPGILATAAALEFCKESFNADLYKQAESFKQQLIAYVHPYLVNSPVNGAPWCVNLAADSGVKMDEVLATSAISFSTGSACNSKSSEPSHVLAACGHRVERIEASYRISFNPITVTQPFIVSVADIINNEISQYERS